MQYIYTNGRFSVKALSYRRDYGDYVDKDGETPITLPAEDD